MDLTQFVASLHRLDRPAILAAADELELQVASAAGEVCWWRATLAIERELRVRHAGRVAAVAARQAAGAVTRAALLAGIDLPDPRVTAVARAAADIARGLAVDAAAVDDLLDGLHHLLAA